MNQIHSLVQERGGVLQGVLREEGGRAAGGEGEVDEALQSWQVVGVEGLIPTHILGAAVGLCMCGGDDVE